MKRLRLGENLFGPDRPGSTGEIIFFKLFELFVVFASMHLAWDWGFYMLRISDVVLPLGLARVIDVSFLFNDHLSLANAAAITLLLLAAYVRLGRYTYLFAFLLLLLQYAGRFSLGEIPHSSNMLGMTLLGISLAVAVFSDDEHRRRFALGFTYFFVGLGYSLAGICKLVGTGVHWPDGRHLWMWIYEKGIDLYSKTGILEFNALQEAALGEYWLATLFLAFGLLTELLAFLVWWRRFRLPVTLAVIGLHYGIFFTMNIMFSLAVYELILLTFPWANWINYAAGRLAWFRRLERLSLRFS